MVHAADRRLDHGDVQRVELVAVLLEIEVRRLAVRADDYVARPRAEVEGHADGFPSRADDDDLLVDALAAVAVGADMRGVAVDAVEPWYVGPDVLQAARERELEGVLVVAHDALTHGIAQLDASRSCLVAAGAAKLGRPDAGKAEKSVDPACLPVARVTRIHEHDVVEITRQPDARAQAGRAAANDCHIEASIG